MKDIDWDLLLQKKIRSPLEIDVFLAIYRKNR